MLAYSTTMTYIYNHNPFLQMAKDLCFLLFSTLGTLRGTVFVDGIVTRLEVSLGKEGKVEGCCRCYKIDRT